MSFSGQRKTLPPKHLTMWWKTSIPWIWISLNPLYNWQIYNVNNLFSLLPSNFLNGRGFACFVRWHILAWICAWHKVRSSIGICWINKWMDFFFSSRWECACMNFNWRKTEAEQWKLCSETLISAVCLRCQVGTEEISVSLQKWMLKPLRLLHTSLCSLTFCLQLVQQ